MIDPPLAPEAEQPDSTAMPGAEAASEPEAETASEPEAEAASEPEAEAVAPEADLAP